MCDHQPFEEENNKIYCIFCERCIKCCIYCNKWINSNQFSRHVKKYCKGIYIKKKSYISYNLVPTNDFHIQRPGTPDCIRMTQNECDAIQFLTSLK
jgi:hypothetical protein